MNFPIYLGLVGIWLFLIKIIKSFNKTDNMKIINNQVSSIHATSVILGYLLGINGTIIHYLSSSYYMTDLFFLLRRFSGNVYDSGLVLHHLVTLTVLNYMCFPETVDYLYLGFFLSELSNIPMYIVYHLKAIKYNNEFVIKSIILIEALGFIICRIILGGKITFIITFYDKMPLIFIVSAWIIFMISCYWSYQLGQQLINSKKKEIKQKKKE